MPYYGDRRKSNPHKDYLLFGFKTVEAYEEALALCDLMCPGPEDEEDYDDDWAESNTERYK